MVTRTLTQIQYTLEKDVVTLDISAEIGASSEVVDDGDDDGYGRSKGMSIRANAGTGEYSLLLDQSWPRFLSGFFSVHGDLTKDVRITSRKLAGATSVLAFDEIVLQVINKSGVAAALTSARIEGVIRCKKSRY